MEAFFIIVVVVIYVTIGIGLWTKRTWPVYKIFTWPLPVIQEQINNKK
jgi:hypothetical protein